LPADQLLFSRTKKDYPTHSNEREDLYCEEDDLVNIKKRLDFSKPLPEKIPEQVHVGKPLPQLECIPKSDYPSLTHRDSIQPKLPLIQLSTLNTARTN